MPELTSLRAFTKLPCSPERLRLLTFNMQVGIRTGGYHHYLLRSWQHFLPFQARESALDNIADLVRPFDLVALQEADGGSWRSGRKNQIQCIAELAGFDHWHHQVNRNLGRFAQHSNGVLCRNRAFSIERHPLPGLPGRGMMILRYGDPEDPLVVAVTHLALRKQTQFSQIRYLVDVLADARKVVIMGDLNQESEWLLQQSPLKGLNLHPVADELPTYPSWQPARGIDHILVSDSIPLHRIAVIDHPQSDHLPVAAEIEL
ncbi:endonuclease/exonuclease/phosphatase family protein [Thalassolituus sp. UBA2590]|uniref:endonuclease/exonuclease/phosphatase family protein n=1 Tax=Thalassolituus sp. UBA2590 TaxID=1947663 RepID=UPI002648654A|nr:endonuclease/exonuclease/phosphatase family protein [Thalassolituus sp. UBA2590]